MNLLYVSSLALDSGPSPCAIRLAVWSIAALSGLLPAATISTTVDWLQCIRQSDEGRMT